ncbi:MAG: hypothetical protein VW362_07035 [Candidatus Nanopelagicales bacterium]
MSLFTVAWVLWISAFIVIEGVALIRKERGDTLSEQVWFALKKAPVLWWVGAGFMLWVTGHFLVPTFGGF